MRVRPPRASGLARLRLGATLALAPLACPAQPAGATSPGSLRECAQLPSDAERLACYDRLAGRASPAAAAPQPAAAPASAAPAPVAAAPASPIVPAAGSAPATPAPAGASFGLYSAEHPKPPPVTPALETRVMSLGHSPSGRMTVTLEGGALWELLDDTDPLLAAGDAVSITRATLGSYLMRTSTHRVHRVRRLR